MKAAILEPTGCVVIADDVEHDSPLPGEVLVRIEAAGVCHTDLTALGQSHSQPTVLGHEGAGIVEAVGSNVSSVQPGDRVVVTLLDFCGHCRYCMSGRQYLCNLVGSGRRKGAQPRLQRGGKEVATYLGVGCFAERVLVNENAVAAVGYTIEPEIAALLGCGVLTGLGAALRTARVEVGDSVAVFGCGGVGLSIVQGARIAGATRIWAIDPIVGKRDLALRLGATDVVDPVAVDVVRRVRAAGRGGVDHAFDAVGQVTTIEQSFEILARGGIATVVGAAAMSESFRLPAARLMLDRRIQGSWMGSSRLELDVAAYVELYLQGRLLLDELISARLSLDDLDEAWSALRRGEGARNVIVFD